jgi:uncharacterized protein (DUF305 family)
VGAAAVVVVGAGIVAALAAGGSGPGGSGSGRAGSGSDGDGARTVKPGAPGEASRELSDDEAAAVETPGHTPADTTFMQDMIVHHRQALTMTALVADRTERDDLPVLAERITETQETEIDQIERWLTDRGEDVPEATEASAGGDAERAGHERMPGMATADQLDRLEEAQGDAFDRLFLDLMIAHHQGALTMVARLYEAGGGLEPAADRFARDVDADQTVEITRMQELLATLG